MAGSNAYGPTVDSTAHVRGSRQHPVLRMSLGIVLILMFIWGLLLQIQTSEAFLLGQGNVEISFSNWHVLTQIYDVMTGTYTSSMAMAIFLAYSIEAAYFTALIFYEMSRTAVRASGVLMERLYMIGILLCVIYNMTSDYTCGTIGSGIFGHVAFSLLATFVEAFFGVIGITLLLRGWKEL